MKTIKRLNEYAVKVQGNLLIAMFLVLLALMLIQVVYRYFLELPLPWSEEMARYVFVIVTYLGASIAASNNSHIEINVRDLLISKLFKSPEPREHWDKILSVISEFVTFAIAAIISYEFVFMVADDYTFDQVSTALGFPMYLVSGFVLVCLIMLTMHCLFRVVICAGELAGPKAA
jgi:TRAP-type C4-dicarboxylate transport system permease small subunit